MVEILIEAGIITDSMSTNDKELIINYFMKNFASLPQDNLRKTLGSIITSENKPGSNRAINLPREIVDALRSSNNRKPNSSLPDQPQGRLADQQNRDTAQKSYSQGGKTNSQNVNSFTSSGMSNPPDGNLFTSGGKKPIGGRFPQKLQSNPPGQRQDQTGNPFISPNTEGTIEHNQSQSQDNTTSAKRKIAGKKQVAFKNTQLADGSNGKTEVPYRVRRENNNTQEKKPDTTKRERIPQSSSKNRGTSSTQQKGAFRGRRIHNPSLPPQGTLPKTNGSQPFASPFSTDGSSTHSEDEFSPSDGNTSASGGYTRNSEATTNDNNSRNSFLSDLANKAKNKLLKKAAMLLLKHPVILVIIGGTILALALIVIVAIGVLSVSDGDNSNNISNTTNQNVVCTYGAAANNGTTTFSSNNVKVELINCMGSSKQYTVLETIDFEKYVLGVALAEMGGSTSESPDEALKAQIIAARNFALTRNQGMCESDPNNCFYGYNASTGIIRMRACENDQVYWDYTQDIYRLARGKISRYSPEVNATTSGVGSPWKEALSADRISHVESVASSIKGEVLMVGSEIVKTNYNASKTAAMRNYAKAGYTYQEILENLYGAGKLEGKKCTQAIVDNSNYQLSTDNNGILSIPLSEFLENYNVTIEDFNTKIYTNVKNAGYATRAGVASAAVTLIGELGNKYNIKLPYYWGGGHAGAIDGSSGNWGSNTCHTSNGDKVYNHCGLDCSGFVSWAIYNGGFRYISASANDFVNIAGAKHVNLSINPVMQPGDLLYNSHHVVLIVDIDSSKNEYICAAATGLTDGVEFKRVPFDASNYSGVDLTGFYENEANKRG